MHLIGPHDSMYQFLGLLEFQSIWSPEGVVVIVDDFQCADVELATDRALRLLEEGFGWEVLFRSPQRAAISNDGRDANGIYVLRKKQ